MVEGWKTPAPITPPPASLVPLPTPSAQGGTSPLRRLALQLDVILKAHAGDHLELLLERVDMLLLVVEDVGEEVAAGIVADLLAMRDRALELAQRLHLELEVAAQNLLDILADVQPAERLEIGQAVEEQDALGQAVGVLHLV